jgi:predicted metal-dependent enzyme (double-stranded beta helix superfamily)
MPTTIAALPTLTRGSPTESPRPRPPGAPPSPTGNTPLPSCASESALSFDALTAIASGLAWAQEPVHGEADDPSARSTLLIATALYDVWLIAWPAGSSIGPHDHGGARSVLQVVEGELIETFSKEPEGPSRIRILRKGDATRGEPPFLHELENHSDAEATSLHVYSPPLSDLTLFPRLSGEQEGRTVAVAGRSPLASSADHGGGSQAK